MGIRFYLSVGRVAYNLQPHDISLEYNLNGKHTFYIFLCSLSSIRTGYIYVTQYIQEMDTFLLNDW